MISIVVPATVRLRKTAEQKRSETWKIFQASEKKLNASANYIEDDKY